MPELYQFSSKLVNLPYKKKRLTKWSNTYTTDLLNIKADWVIHIDEDSFMFDSSRIEPLLMYMEENGYVCAGMPDGGVLDIRFHNPVACNAFFLVLHRKAIVKHMNDIEEIKNFRWHEEYREFTPAIVKEKDRKYEYCECESFYGLYFWLCSLRLPILYMDAEEWIGEYERTSCLLKDHTGVPFLLHTWYSHRYRVLRIRLRTVRSGRQLLQYLRSKISPLKKGPSYERINRAMDYVKKVKKNTNS